MANFYGMAPPWVGGQQGVLSRQEDDRLIKNDIYQLLTTTPGERVHRPNFGTIVMMSLFEPLTDSILDDIRSSILQALRLEEPRLIDPQVSVTALTGLSGVNVIVSGRLTSDPASTFEMSFSLKKPGT